MRRTQLASRPCVLKPRGLGSSEERGEARCSGNRWVMAIGTHTRAMPLRTVRRHKEERDPR